MLFLSDTRAPSRILSILFCDLCAIVMYRLFGCSSVSLTAVQSYRPYLSLDVHKLSITLRSLSLDMWFEIILTMNNLCLRMTGGHLYHRNDCTLSNKTHFATTVKPEVTTICEQLPPVNNGQFESSTASLNLSFIRHLCLTDTFFRPQGWPLYTGLTVTKICFCYFYNSGSQPWV